MKVTSIYGHIKVMRVPVPELGLPGLSTVISLAGDQLVLNRYVFLGGCTTGMDHTA